MKIDFSDSDPLTQQEIQLVKEIQKEIDYNRNLPYQISTFPWAYRIVHGLIRPYVKEVHP